MSEDADDFDAFAELGLLRKVAVDDGELETAWRELSRRWHPDSPEGDPQRSAKINRAYQTLKWPGQRLRHWLALHGRSAGDTAMSEEMMTLFSTVGGALQAADEVLKKRSAATTALGKAVLAEAEWESQSALQALMGDLTDKTTGAVEKFAQIDASDGEKFSLAESIAASLGFLEKWQAQIRERLVALMAG